MNAANLQPGDRIEVRVNDEAFDARFDGPAEPGAHKPYLITPDDSWRSVRHVTARQIVKKLGSGVAG